MIILPFFLSFSRNIFVIHYWNEKCLTVLFHLQFSASFVFVRRNMHYYSFFLLESVKDKHSEVKLVLLLSNILYIEKVICRDEVKGTVIDPINTIVLTWIPVSKHSIMICSKLSWNTRVLTWNLFLLLSQRKCVGR